MKTTGMTKLLVALAINAAAAGALFGADKKQSKNGGALQNELSSLGEGGNFGAVANEKLFVVQERHNPLTNAWQGMIGVGKNLNPNIYLNTQETSVAFRYYVNDWFYAQLDGAQYQNDLSPSGQRIWENDGIYPDTAFVENRYGAAVGFNILYGKIRVLRNFVVYFDQYLALGVSGMEQSNGVTTSTVPAVTGDIGLSFSVGPTASLMFGVRDNYFEEKRRTSAGEFHQMVAYSSLGVLLGGKAL